MTAAHKTIAAHIHGIGINHRIASRTQQMHSNCRKSCSDFFQPSITTPYSCLAEQQTLNRQDRAGRVWIQGSTLPVISHSSRGAYRRSAHNMTPRNKVIWLPFAPSFVGGAPAQRLCFGKLACNSSRGGFPLSFLWKVLA